MATIKDSIFLLLTNKHKEIPAFINCASASWAGVVSTTVSFPFDLLKIQAQMYGALQQKDTMPTSTLIKLIYKFEGIRGFYHGLSASCIRQTIFAGGRGGLFKLFVDNVSTKYEDGVLPMLYIESVVGLCTGVIAGFCSLPADVIMTRMAADGGWKSNWNYTGLKNAFITIMKDEGPKGFFTGFGPAVLRGTILNASQFVGYLQAKNLILRNDLLNDNMYCHTASSIMAAVIATINVLPADLAKTRIQTMNTQGKPEYSGIIDVWSKVIRSEGFHALWKGFVPMFYRNSLHFVTFFLVYENCILLYLRLSV